MPKTPRTPTSSFHAPYDQPSSPLEDCKPTLDSAKSPKKTKSTSGELSSRRPWTNDEFLQLFEHVIQTLAPFLRSAIETRRGR
ncbi:hypothetical protein L486_02174 [Kwoniella mangroviensis CBS 10435]|uniref:Uncharacterized protein n=1 Tax=Kwoniella mangroviensis CBS 10435 TaxID=1331196 RepID=A0A1B9IVG0_9TREE|nr:hypothetical protein L486_02174 [Kwoniella mangroviensis CBS 10435]